MSAKRRKACRGASRLPLAALLVAVAAACAGDGTGLDQFGNPIEPGGPPPLGPTLASLQANVFTPGCSCHLAASAPAGLSLAEGRSFENLVGVPSTEQPGLLRVEPGNPDRSYLIRKVEGGPDIVGARMPLGTAPLTPAQIQALRDWIAQGALNN